VTLLDDFVPHPDFVERHEVAVRAAPAVAYRAIWDTDFRVSPVIRWLLLLRSLPGSVFSSREVPRPGRSLTLQTVIEGGFGLLAEAPGAEVVLGVAGRFWRPVGNLEPFRREDFTGALPDGLAKAVWSFAVHERGAGQLALITTETRIVCADAASRRKFGAYWTLIGPFSGLIRTLMLRAIRRTCEGAPPGWS
jgi:hypothetical protein